ncbi:hypothetical protein BHU72_12650 [Desulfuribacillus stibiiarsenatis]|uniref:SpoOB alpha-helical domain-containing protein n=1 Tax=Desulfuribacillus stibiiarsenatis TaxID=1390249 RepID=A0A1E5L294_9FIRM|nr:Spo0B domain-containing protein [Desulfuribacillus stibiiarsenatis]OEH84247.1 hypothetical protein BHU72_12650 [Desulfuribacillus stibiiarsenatis]
MEILDRTKPYSELIHMMTDLRHDMVNHLQVIHAYAKLDGNDRIIQYIDGIAHEFKMHSRLSNIGSHFVAAKLISFMMRYPELQIDCFIQSKNILFQVLPHPEYELANIMIDVCIALAAQETKQNKMQIAISIEDENSIVFTLYGKSLEEKPGVLACLHKKLSRYNVFVQQNHQDSEVFEWELSRNNKGL